MGAQRDLEEWEGWGEEVRQAGIDWQFSPTACAWRNGQAERLVGLAKHTLGHQIERHETLNFAELETALMRVAELLNRRPLAVRTFGESDFHPVCPADLLLGRIYGYKPQPEEGVEPGQDDIQLPLRQEKTEALVEIWWQRWTSAAFPLLCPRRHWTQLHRNLEIGDIVLLKHDKALGKGEYRLGRVTKTLPDSDGTVRTVMIAVRKRRGAVKEAVRECRLGLEEFPMAIQRLVVIQPAGESWENKP